MGQGGRNGVGAEAYPAGLRETAVLVDRRPGNSEPGGGHCHSRASRWRDSNRACYTLDGGPGNHWPGDVVDLLASRIAVRSFRVANSTRDRRTTHNGLSDARFRGCDGDLQLGHANGVVL